MRIRSSLRVLTLEASCASGEGHNQASWENAFERTDCIILGKLLGWGMAYSCVKIKGKPEEKKKGEQTNLEDERGKLHLCPLVVSNLRSDDDHTSLSPHPLSPSRPLPLSPSCCNLAPSINRLMSHVAPGPAGFLGLLTVKSEDPIDSICDTEFPPEGRCPTRCCPLNQRGRNGGCQC